MKKLFLILTIQIVSFSLIAQQPHVPAGKLPVKPQTLPAPKIAALAPDLVVTEINFVRGGLNAAGDQYNITVHLTIKNTGTANAPASKLDGSYQRESTHGFYWAGTDTKVNIPAIAAGASISGDYTLQIKRSNLGAGTYSFPFKAFIDPLAEVKELNEANNMSDAITITVHL